MIKMYQSIINHFYPEETPLKQLLLRHSQQVCAKALCLAHACSLKLSDNEIINGAMLHDIGIMECHAPGILCNGTEHYLCHGLIGARMLRQYGMEHHLDLAIFEGVCAHHTGTGITRNQIIEHSLPLPPDDYLPQTPLEYLICYADKFFSKSGDLTEKSYERVRRETLKFGEDSLKRLEQMHAMFLA